ncbi:MAG TPA: hypothetical protein VLB79_00390 [Solirubrobacterales bacterium]|nr:hypothetical protein [Solirubrobacterales bacterium]
MLRERGRVLVFAAALVTALAVAGCGSNDFKNDPRPPVPAEVSVKIAKDGVAVSPKEFGAGLVSFTIANLTTQPGTFSIHGPVNAGSSEIPPAGTGQLKVDMKTGSYEASVSGIAAAPFSFTVGAERQSGQNDLLLP